MKNQLRKYSSILMIALLAVSCQKSGSEDQQSGGTLIASKKHIRSTSGENQYRYA